MSKTLQESGKSLVIRREVSYELDHQKWSVIKRFYRFLGLKQLFSGLIILLIFTPMVYTAPVRPPTRRPSAIPTAAPSYLTNSLTVSFLNTTFSKRYHCGSGSACIEFSSVPCTSISGCYFDLSVNASSGMGLNIQLTSDYDSQNPTNMVSYVNYGSFARREDSKSVLIDNYLYASNQRQMAENFISDTYYSTTGIIHFDWGLCYSTYNTSYIRVYFGRTMNNFTFSISSYWSTKGCNTHYEYTQTGGFCSSDCRVYEPTELYCIYKPKVLNSHLTIPAPSNEVCIRSGITKPVLSGPQSDLPCNSSQYNIPCNKDNYNYVCYLGQCVDGCNYGDVFYCGYGQCSSYYNRNMTSVEFTCPCDYGYKDFTASSITVNVPSSVPLPYPTATSPYSGRISRDETFYCVEYSFPAGVEAVVLFCLFFMTVLPCIMISCDCKNKIQKMTSKLMIMVIGDSSEKKKSQKIRVFPDPLPNNDNGIVAVKQDEEEGIKLDVVAPPILDGEDAENMKKEDDDEKKESSSTVIQVVAQKGFSVYGSVAFVLTVSQPLNADLLNIFGLSYEASIFCLALVSLFFDGLGLLFILFEFVLCRNYCLKSESLQKWKERWSAWSSIANSLLLFGILMTAYSLISPSSVFPVTAIVGKYGSSLLGIYSEITDLYNFSIKKIQKENYPYCSRLFALLSHYLNTAFILCIMFGLPYVERQPAALYA